MFRRACPPLFPEGFCFGLKSPFKKLFVKTTSLFLLAVLLPSQAFAINPRDLIKKQRQFFIAHEEDRYDSSRRTAQQLTLIENQKAAMIDQKNSQSYGVQTAKHDTSDGAAIKTNEKDGNPGGGGGDTETISANITQVRDLPAVPAEEIPRHQAMTTRQGVANALLGTNFTVLGDGQLVSDMTEIAAARFKSFGSAMVGAGFFQLSYQIAVGPPPSDGSNSLTFSYNSSYGQVSVTALLYGYRQFTYEGTFTDNVGNRYEGSGDWSDGGKGDYTYSFSLKLGRSNILGAPSNIMTKYLPQATEAYSDLEVVREREYGEDTRYDFYEGNSPELSVDVMNSTIENYVIFGIEEPARVRETFEDGRTTKLEIESLVSTRSLLLIPRAGKNFIQYNSYGQIRDGIAVDENGFNLTMTDGFFESMVVGAETLHNEMSEEFALSMKQVSKSEIALDATLPKKTNPPNVEPVDKVKVVDDLERDLLNYTSTAVVAGALAELRRFIDMFGIIPNIVVNTTIIPTLVTVSALGVFSSSVKYGYYVKSDHKLASLFGVSIDIIQGAVGSFIEMSLSVAKPLFEFLSEDYAAFHGFEWGLLKYNRSGLRISPLLSYSLGASSGENANKYRIGYHLIDNVFTSTSQLRQNDVITTYESKLELNDGAAFALALTVSGLFGASKVLGVQWAKFVLAAV